MILTCCLSVSTKKAAFSCCTLMREALIRLALPSTQSTKPEQLLEDDLPSPADMSSQATTSEDQSQVPTPSTITPDLPAFEHELRRRKVLDADAEEISEQFSDDWEDIQRILCRIEILQSPLPMSIGDFAGGSSTLAMKPLPRAFMPTAVKLPFRQ